MKSISFLKDPATFVVLAGMMLGLAGVVSAQVGGAGGGGAGGVGGAGIGAGAGIGGGAGDAGSVGVPGAANEGTIGIPGGVGDAGSAGGAGGMVSPKAVDSMTGQHGPMGGRPPYASGSAVSGETPPSPATSPTSGSERQGYGFTGVAPGGGSTAPGATSGTGE